MPGRSSCRRISPSTCLNRRVLERCSPNADCTLRVLSACLIVVFARDARLAYAGGVDGHERHVTLAHHTQCQRMIAFVAILQCVANGVGGFVCRRNRLVADYFNNTALNHCIGW